MLHWFFDRLLRLRTWLRVGLGLWRGRWRRGRVSVSGAQLLGGPFGVHRWRYGLYAPAGLGDDEAAPLAGTPQPYSWRDYAALRNRPARLRSAVHTRTW